MNSKEKWLLGKLSCYVSILDDIERIKSQLQTTSYKTTATYGHTTGGGSRGVSKVETLGLRRLELERQMRQHEALIRQIDAARAGAGLNGREYALIECVIFGGNLSSYARSANIYKSHVYKIRDRAIRKMLRFMEDNTK